MEKRIKMWTRAGMVAMVGAGSLHLAADAAPLPTAGAAMAPTGWAAGALLTLAAAHGASHGVAVAPGEAQAEGEGEGEGEGAAAADLASDDAALLTQLGLMGGHLWIGHQLYREGQQAAAATHMKHPEDELYGGLRKALVARGITPFDAELSALANAVEHDQGRPAVAAAYANLTAAMAAAQRQVAASPHDTLRAAAALLRTAGDEYGLAVDDAGKVINAHEYQDAFGFVTLADTWVSGLNPGTDAALVAAVADLQRTIKQLYAAWPGVVPPDTVATRAWQLHGAASQAEITVQQSQ